MMRRFKGRSAETYRIKGKPTPEGFKFFAIVCSVTGYIYSLLPHGRVSEERGIIDTVIELVKSLPERLKRKYVVAMDNYFTYSRALNELRNLGKLEPQRFFCAKSVAM